MRRISSGRVRGSKGLRITPRAHAFQGTAGSYGFAAVSAAAVSIEEQLEPHLDAARPADAGLWTGVEASLERLRRVVEAARAGS